MFFIQRCWIWIENTWASLSVGRLQSTPATPAMTFGSVTNCCVGAVTNCSVERCGAARSFLKWKLVIHTVVWCTLIAYSCTSRANVLLAVWASPKLHSLGLNCWQRLVVAMVGRSITAPYVYLHLALHCGRRCCILERCPAWLAVCWLAGTVLDSLSATRCLLRCGV
jgi:hypothetical protein